MVITGIETQIGTRYTEETIRFLRSRLPQVNFVWLMGADNLASFHRWKNWENIAALVPMAIIDRPGSTLKAVSSPAARSLARYRIDESDARLLPRLAAPALAVFCMASVPPNPPPPCVRKRRNARETGEMTLSDKGNLKPRMASGTLSDQGLIHVGFERLDFGLCRVQAAHAGFHGNQHRQTGEKQISPERSRLLQGPGVAPAIGRRSVQGQSPDALHPQGL